VWTAAELEELTRDERHRLLDERVVTDVSLLSPELRARARARGRRCWKPGRRPAHGGSDGRAPGRPRHRYVLRPSSTIGPERGPHGEPSSTDFDGLPEIVEGFSAGRMLAASGLLVHAFAIFGLLMTDGTIEIVGVEVDRAASAAAALRSPCS
jgi:hypothetical protein